MNRCSSCRFFDGMGNDKGICRRYPPSSSEDSYLKGHPPADKSGWCGEHKLKPTKKTKKEPSSNVQDVIAFYCEEFKAAFDVNPSITGKDSGAAINMLKDHTKSDVCRTISEYFKDTPTWYKDQGLYGLNNIASAWNKMTVRRKIDTESADDITYVAMLNEQRSIHGDHPRFPEYEKFIWDTHEIKTFEEFLKEYGEE